LCPCTIEICLTRGWRCETGLNVCCVGIPARPTPRPACVVTDPSHPHSTCPCRVPVRVFVLMFLSHSSRACCLALRVYARPPVRPCARIQRLYVCATRCGFSLLQADRLVLHLAPVLLGFTYSRPVCRVWCERGCAMCWQALGWRPSVTTLAAACCRCMPSVVSF
jgi:hypothetical protein